MTYREMFNKKYKFKSDASHSLKEISDLSGFQLSGLKTIFKKGVGAYKTNPQSVRPFIKSPQEWAYARVYSAVMGGKASIIDSKHLKKK